MLNNFTYAARVTVAALLACLSASLSVRAQEPIQTPTAVYTTPFTQFGDVVSARSRNAARPGNDIGDGGGAVGGSVDLNETLLGVVTSEGLITVSGSGQEVTGFEFNSPGGLLVPVPTVDGVTSPAPFEALLFNTPSRVAFGNVGSTLQVDRAISLAVGYRGLNPEEELSAVWGSGVEAIPFPVTRFGSRNFSPFNLSGEGPGDVILAEEVVYTAVIEAGSAAGTPPDSPAARVDPNDATGVFPGVGSLEVVHPTLGTFICTGSVIDDTHVLTAAHCFDLDNDGAVDAGLVAGSSFHLNDGGSPSSTTAFSAIDIHPDFGGFSTSGANDDFAIVTLASSVPAGTTKYAIRTSGMATSEVIEMVGYGTSGFGDVGGTEVLPDFNVKRSGKNEVDVFVVDDEGSGQDELFIYDFDGPSGTGVSGGATLGNDVETNVRAGDSGGPAFVEENGERVIAGINTFEFAIPNITAPPGEFGVLGGGVLIDEPQFAWISSIATGAVDSQIVPEPSAIAMVLTSLCALGIARRRRDA